MCVTSIVTRKLS